MEIRETTEVDLKDILFIEQAAFNSHKEANLTKNLLSDHTAEPRISLIATVQNKPAGHILFTKGQLSTTPDIKVSILVPLAVVPKFQRQDVGGSLIRRGVQLLSKAKVGLVFVIGWPDYYPRFGFIPAIKLGFEPPFPIPEKDVNAWMVQALRPNIIGSISSKVFCCSELNKPEHWRE